MFTTVTKPKVADHRFTPDQPVPEIIDHRLRGPRDGRWSTGQTASHKTYDSIKHQLEVSIATEKKLTGRIKELEKENEKLLEVYESTNTENNILKSHMKHGPSAQKIKQLQKDKKEIEDELNKKVEENQILFDQIKEFEQTAITTKDLYVEKNWRKAVEMGRQRREEKDAAVGTQGPFKEANYKQKKGKNMTDELFETQDSRDLQIDNLEKGTLILLNNIRLFKQNKEDIDYANFIGKGAITRNKAVKDAINEKLDRDLESFANRLDALQRKAKHLKVNKGKDDSDATPNVSTPPNKPTNGADTSNSIKSNKNVVENVSSNKASVSSKNNVRNTHNSVSADSTSNTTSATKRETKNKDNASFAHGKKVKIGSPIVNHWDHLAEKLIKTEKYGGSKSGRQQNHRNGKPVTNGQSSAQSNNVMKVSSPNPLKSYHHDNSHINRTYRILSPTSSYSETSNNSEQSQTHVTSKSNSTEFQSEGIRFVSTQRSFQKNQNGNYDYVSALKNRRQNQHHSTRANATAKEQNKVKEQTKETEQSEEIDNDEQEITRDVSAYDAVLLDLKTQHEVHEKVQRTTSVSRQHMEAKTKRQREMYNKYDTANERRMSSPKSLNYTANNYLPGSYSARTLNLL